MAHPGGMREPQSPGAKAERPSEFMATVLLRPMPVEILLSSSFGPSRPRAGFRRRRKAPLERALEKIQVRLCRRRNGHRLDILPGDHFSEVVIRPRLDAVSLQRSRCEGRCFFRGSQHAHHRCAVFLEVVCNVFTDAVSHSSGTDYGHVHGASLSQIVRLLK